MAMQSNAKAYSSLQKQQMHTTFTQSHNGEMPIYCVTGNLQLVAYQQTDATKMLCLHCMLLNCPNIHIYINTRRSNR